MKVLLSTAPEIKPKEEAEIRAISPHAGLAYIASYLASKNIQTKIIDPKAENLKLHDFIERIKQINPDMVGFNSYTVEILDIKTTLRKIKELNPKIITVLGGPHATSIPKKALEELQDLDLVIVSEGEIPFYDLVTALKNKKPLNKVRGIAFRDKGKITVTPFQKLVMNIEEFPYPAWNLFPLERYKGHFCVNDFFKTKEDSLELPVLTMRGCPYQCIFCFKTTPLVRFRKVEDIIKEIKYNIENYKVKRIYFIEGTFGIQRANALELCNQLIKEGLNKKIKWSANIRVDILDKDLLQKMIEAGCEYITIGVESGSTKILKTMKKRITREEIINKFRMINQIEGRHKIKVNGSFVLGVPYETKETLNETINLIKKIKLDQVSFSILVAFPGTEVVELAKRGIGGLYLKHTDWQRYSKQEGGSVGLKQLSYSDLKKYQMKAYLTAYLTNKKILELIKMVGLRKLLKVSAKNIIRIFTN